MIRVENVYDSLKENGVQRFLIEHEWPRGLVRFIPHKEKSGQSREDLANLEWVPQLAPSAELWKWFHHDPDKVSRFRSRYFRELEGMKKYWDKITQECRKNKVLLLHSGKRADQTPAHFLKEFLENQREIAQVSGQVKHKVVSLPGKGIAPPVEKAISRKHKLPIESEISF